MESKKLKRDVETLQQEHNDLLDNLKTKLVAFQTKYRQLQSENNKLHIRVRELEIAVEKLKKTQNY